MFRISFIHCSFILVLIITGYSVLAQSETENEHAQYTITKRLLSVEDGFASHEVFCGLQDTAGFLWFGTRNGLNRYDGKNCLLFTRQRNELQDNKVVQLAKDDAGNLLLNMAAPDFSLPPMAKWM